MTGIETSETSHIASTLTVLHSGRLDFFSQAAISHDLTEPTVLTGDPESVPHFLAYWKALQPLGLVFRFPQVMKQVLNWF